MRERDITGTGGRSEADDWSLIVIVLFRFTMDLPNRDLRLSLLGGVPLFR